MGRKGPATGRPGFMSKVSRWLAPPAIHRRMQRLGFFCASWAIVSELKSAPQLPTAIPAAPRTVPLRIALRVTCSDPPQAQGFTSASSMVEPEFRGVEKHPDRLLDKRVGLRAAGEV